MSVEYYYKLERGNISGASEAVLHSIAGALQLDDAERAHLFDLARASSAPLGQAQAPYGQVRHNSAGIAAGPGRGHCRTGIRA
nr:helix-turn-helix transcriptional regulator [Arthrobacter sp. ISL-69]